MADQSDVENALVEVAFAALYPSGTTEPSVPGPICRVYRGWPNSTALNTDLVAGKINVTVFPGQGSGSNMTRYAKAWLGSPIQPVLTAVVAANSVTFGGSADPGQIAGILIDGRSYAYRTQTADTPALVAANLRELARDHSIIQLSGCTITIAGAGDLVARVMADVRVQQEVRRQRQVFRVICWCPTPASRDNTSTAIDQALSQLRFIALQDGSQGRLIYDGTTVFDQSQDANLYRRDLMYSVEYATIISDSQPAMLFGDLVLNSTATTV
jgi:hypothetical protein